MILPCRFLARNVGFNVGECSQDRAFAKTRPDYFVRYLLFTYLDAEFGALRRTIRHVLTLARESCVVVILPRHHSQDGLYSSQRTVIVRLLRGFDATV